MRAFGILLALMLAGPASAAEPVSLGTVRTIALDPGHGGDNTGCMGFHGVLEKHVTLEIAHRVHDLLRTETDARVLLTRQGDEYVGIRERARIANRAGADIFVSIHINAAANVDAQGVETYFLSLGAANQEAAALVAREEGPPPIGITPDEVRKGEADAIVAEVQRQAAHGLSELLASAIQKRLVRKLRARDRGVKQAPFDVLRESAAPAVVVELGFLTNQREGMRLLLADYQDKIAEAIVAAIIAYDRTVTDG